MSIAAFLTHQQVAFETIQHPPAYTAQQRAKVLHVPGRYVAKTLLLRGLDGFFLAVLPAIHHVDGDRLAAALGTPVRLAYDEEITQVFHDCEWGVVPPFGRLYGLRTILDESIPSDAFIVFEGQSHVEAIRLRCADFERLEQPQRLSFATPQRETLSPR
jgi:Ala-tRNA(Pro) deacylase